MPRKKKTSDAEQSLKPGTFLVTPAVTPEQRALKLRELAGQRLPRALNAIRLVGNLAAYNPTEAQSNQILRALVGAVNALKDRLAGGSPASAFTLE